jgi:hypothetical protein
MPGILPVDCGAAFSDMKNLLKNKIKTPTWFYPIWIYLNIPSPPLRRVWHPFARTQHHASQPPPSPHPSSQPAIIIRVTRNFPNLLSLARELIIRSTIFLKIISSHLPVNWLFG